MCGISALIDASGQLDLALYIRKMSDLIAHRGPDDEGYLTLNDDDSQLRLYGGETTPGVLSLPKISDVNGRGNKLALGHRRLAILDVSEAGHQPYLSEDKRYALVYNGEIYNYLELRKELELLGHQFHSHTDTEVLLKAYSQWGEACLQRFNGMFAFVVYDRKTKLFFAARDRFGIKPLYYWVSPAGFLAFASEIKQFTVLPGWQAKANSQHAYDFLAWGLADYDGETIFGGVMQLPVGAYFTFSCAMLDKQKLAHLPKPKRWYGLNAKQSAVSSYEDACDGVRFLLGDAVKLRLRADVKVGTGLSGGIDSSTIVGMVDELLRGKKLDNKELQYTFSAYCDIPELDEREYIQSVLDKADVKHFGVTPSLDGLFQTFDKLAWQQDEPFSGPSIFAEYSVYQLASQSGVKVTLDGHGADELFGGYHTFFAVFLRDLFKNFQFATLARQWRSIKELHGYNAGFLLRSLAKLMPAYLSGALYSRFASGFDNKSAWLNAEKFGHIDKLHRHRFDRGGASFSDFSIGQLTQSSTPFQLHWADRDAMANSVENRVPFLDHRLVEFVLGLPAEFKVDAGVTKKVLRSAVADLLPEKVFNRVGKLGYVTPEEYWFTQQGAKQFSALLESSVSQLQGLVNPQLLKLFHQPGHQGLAYNPCLWRVVSFAAWQRCYGVDLK